MPDAQATDAELTFQKGGAIGFGDISAAGWRLAHQFVGQRRQALSHIGHLAGDGGGRFTAAGQRLQGCQIQIGEIGMRPFHARRCRAGRIPVNHTPVRQCRFGRFLFSPVRHGLGLFQLRRGTS